MTETNEELSNQTLFSNELPILQPDEGELPESNQVSLSAADQAKKKQKKLLIMFGVGSAVLVGCLLILLIISPKPKRILSAVSPTPSASAMPLPDQFQATVNELNTDLQNADPTQVDLAVPPVDLSLTLDPLSH